MGKKMSFFMSLAVMVIVVACSRNEITGRNQLSLVSESQLQEMAKQEYASFLNENRAVSSNSSRDAAMVKRVGSRLANAITSYYRSKGQASFLNGYQWEFNLVDNKDVNAWCMPGGKVVVYTGLLSITQNEAALAVVLGHEITHAVAGHGRERMSQAMLAQDIQVAGNVALGKNADAVNVFNNVYGPTATLGVLLPNSRKQESEADHFGLIFTAMAGYNPQEAVNFWQRMAALSANSAKPPTFLSDHPSDEQRIKDIQGWMKEALGYYQPMR